MEGLFTQLIYHVFINENNPDVEYGSERRYSHRSYSHRSYSHRSLLLTVLGELVLPNGASAWTQTLIAVLAELGVGEKAARQTISRGMERGWLEGTKSGRRTRWSLTPQMEHTLSAGAARIYGFGQTETAWNGRWLLVTASLPQKQRNLRYAISTSMSWAGFGSLGHGWWISPRTSAESEMRQILAIPEVRDVSSFVARHGAVGDPSALASRAWDLASVRSEYEAFLADVDHLKRRREEGSGNAKSPAADLVALTHSWRSFPMSDPLLPEELLPQKWPGPQAVKAFKRLHDEWRTEAHQWWNHFESQVTN